MANVKDFGALGDGSSDDTNSIRSALGSVLTGGRIYFPTGTYRVTGQLTVPRNVHVVGDGIDATVVTAKGAADDQFAPGRAVFYFSGGGFKRLSSLAGDLKRFDVSVPVVSADGIVADDVIVLINSTPGSYNQVRPAYNAGEFLHVNEVKANTIRVAGSVQASYSKNSSIELYKMLNPTRSSIVGMTVIGNGSRAGESPLCVRFQCGRGVFVRDVRLAGAFIALCEFFQCFGASAENVEGDQIFSPPAIGLNYGIVISNCQDVRVSNCRLVAMRHAVAVGGHGGAPNSPNPVNRQISVSNCDLKSSSGNWALDAHGNTELYTYENNRCHGGISFGGWLGKIIGNDIFGTSEKGFYNRRALYGEEWKGTEFEIRNNRIHTDVGGGNDEAVGFVIHAQTDFSGPTILQNNRIVLINGTKQAPVIRLTNSGSQQRWGVIIDGNDFYASPSGSANVVLERVSGAPFDYVIMRNNTIRTGRLVCFDGPPPTSGPREEVAYSKIVAKLVFTGNWP